MTESKSPSPTNFKAGFVAVVGRPNVGKSTLLNLLIGQKIAAVSNRPQTTRRRQLGILTLEDTQIIFIDTPGLHVPHHKLGEAMNQAATEALEDCDCVLWLVDLSQPPHEEDRLIAERLTGYRKPKKTLMILNKADRQTAEENEINQQKYIDLMPGVKTLLFSARDGLNLAELLEQIKSWLPVSQPYYEADQITDLYEKDIVADLVREAALIHLHDEVPHCIAVRIDQFTERGELGAYIFATLFVEKESQKGIVIGDGGEMIKKIGSTARYSIEKMSGRKIFLELRVKVNKNWRENPTFLKHLGFFE